MDIGTFERAVTRTVTHVYLLRRGRRGELRCDLSFECGHTYVWHGWGASQHPRHGERLMCAKCIDYLLGDK